MRIFKKMRSLIRLLTEVIKDIRFFAVVLIMAVIGFAIGHNYIARENPLMGEIPFYDSLSIIYC